MKGKIFILAISVVLMGCFMMFQAPQSAVSSPIFRITMTPEVTPTLPATLPPPPIPTDPPLIPVTGVGDGAGVDGLVIGGLVVLILGVVGLAWPAKKTGAQHTRK